MMCRSSGSDDESRLRRCHALNLRGGALDRIYLFPNRATLIVHKDNGDYDLISGAQVTSASVEAGDNGR